MEDGVEEKSKKIAELAPVVGAAQGDSIVDLIEGYEELAESLGADVDGGDAAAAKAEFEAARDAFSAAAAAKPGLTALAISPYDDKLRRRRARSTRPSCSTSSAGASTSSTRTKPDPDFPYWQSLSFENADTYQPDLLLFDDRNYPGNLETLEAQPIADEHQGLRRGRVHDLAGLLAAHLHATTPSS